jgi:tetratricopeptide (TPR) repeat protein
VTRRKRRAPSKVAEARPLATPAAAKVPRESRRALGWSAAIVIACGLAAYAGSVPNGFTYDDQMVVVDAAPLLASGSLGALFADDYAIRSGEAAYRPVVTTSYMIDHALWGLWAPGFHLQSLLLHLIAALLVWRLADRLLAAHRPAGVMAGALFAVHPVLSEAVDNISFREDGLTTVFTLAAILLALRGTRRATAGALVATFVALFSKEMAVATPLLYLGARACLPAEERRPWRGTVAGMAAILIGFFVVRFGLMNAPQYAKYEYAGKSLLGTIAAMPQVFAHYLRLLVVPWPLCADYRGYFRFELTPILGAVVVPWLVVGAYGAAIAVSLRRLPVVALGLGWFFVALLPVSNIIPMPVPVAERFLYLPFVGIAIAAAGLAAWTPRRRLACGAVAAVVAVLAVVSNLRHPVWKSEETLWTRTVADFPTSWGAQRGMGTMLAHSERGREALPYLYRALEIGPDPVRTPETGNDIGVVYLNLTEFAKAEQILADVVAREPYHDAYYNLGVARMSLHRYPEADAAFAAAVTTYPFTYAARALAFQSVIASLANDEARAAQLLERARLTDPDDETVRRLGAPSTATPR